MEERILTLAQQEGPAYWFLTTLTIIKVTGEQAGGAFSLVEQHFPPGPASPWHVHHKEDETFFVLEGKATFMCGDQVIPATPGTTLLLPKGVPHGFRADEPLKLLVFATPPGFEQFVIEAGQPAAELTLPPPPDGPPDIGALAAVAAKYSIDILGPLPDF